MRVRSPDLKQPFALILVLLLASAFMRFYQLDSVPAGMAGDVAYNGLDIRQVLAGHPSIFFEASNGREPLFIYFQALLVAFAGYQTIVFTFSSAAMSMLTVAASYRFFRELFGWRTALISAALLSFALWSVIFSRIGLRTTSAAPFLLTVLYCLWKLLHTGRRWYAIAGGVALGLSLYTYLSARLIPVLVVLICLVEWRATRKRLPEVALLVVVSLAVFGPEGVYFFQHREAFIERAAQVSVFNPHPDVVGPTSTPLRSLVRTGQMFFIHGDDNPRDDLSGLPVFDPWLAAFFAGGLVLAFVRAFKERRYGWPILYMILMCLPSALTHSSPEWGQSLLATPAIFVFPAIAIDYVLHAIPWRKAGYGLAALALVIAGVQTFVRFFYEWAPTPETASLFGVSAGRVASLVNTQSPAKAYVAFPFDDTIPTFRLDVRQTLETSWFPAEGAFVPLPAQPRDVLYVAAAGAALSDLGPSAVPGIQPVGTTDDPFGRPAFTVYKLSADAIARFLQAQKPVGLSMGNDFRLVSYEAVSPPGRLVVNLVWQQLQPAGPYDLNIHLLAADGHTVAQSDHTVWPLERIVGPGTHHWDATATLSDDDLLLTQHAFQAPPGQYTLEIGAVHLGINNPWTAGTPISGPVGELAHLPVMVNG